MSAPPQRRGAARQQTGRARIRRQQTGRACVTSTKKPHVTVGSCQRTTRQTAIQRLSTHAVRGDKVLLIYIGATRILWQEVYLANRESAVISLNTHGLEDFKKCIQADVSLLRNGFKDPKGGSWTIAGDFTCRSESKSRQQVYIFSQRAHVTCSSCTYANFQSLINNIEIDHVYCDECEEHDHIFLEPFFRDNGNLHRYFEQRLKKREHLEERERLELDICATELPVLTSVLERTTVHTGIYFTSSAPDLDAFRFQENDWSIRLAHGLSRSKVFESFEFKFTGNDCIRSTFDLVQFNITRLIDPDCYVFTGTPDIRVKRMISDCHSIVICADLDSSDEEFSIENKKQPDPTEGTLPPKVGELLAQMNMLIAQRCLKTVIRDGNTARLKARREFKVKGMYIHKQYGTTLATMTLPVIKVGTDDKRILRIHIEQAYGSILSSALLCSRLKQLCLPRRMVGSSSQTGDSTHDDQSEERSTPSDT